MCGIAGFWDKHGADAAVAEQMALQIRLKSLHF